jgi:hypothetical protein
VTGLPEYARDVIVERPIETKTKDSLTLSDRPERIRRARDIIESKLKIPARWNWPKENVISFDPMRYVEEYLPYYEGDSSIT